MWFVTHLWIEQLRKKNLQKHCQTTENQSFTYYHIFEVMLLSDWDPVSCWTLILMLTTSNHIFRKYFAFIVDINLNCLYMSFTYWSVICKIICSQNYIYTLPCILGNVCQVHVVQFNWILNKTLFLLLHICIFVLKSHTTHNCIIYVVISTNLCI